MTRAIVFDLDGTLVDSMPFVVRAFRHAVEPFAAWPDEHAFRAQLGGPYEDCLRRLLGVEAAERLPEARARLFAFAEGHEELVVPFAGAADLLARLDAAGVRRAIWTSREGPSAWRILRHWKLDTGWDGLVAAEDFALHKPHPAGLRHLLGQWAGPGPRLVVGDSDVDVLGAAAAGVPAVLIRHQHRFEPELLARTCHQVATPAEAYAWVAETWLMSGAD